MADTQRTLAQLLAILADNLTGDISPQDMRDLVVSLRPSGGGLYKSGATVATVIDTVNVAKLMNAVTSGIDYGINFTADAAGRLTYTGAIPKFVFLRSAIAFVGENNKLISFTFAVNGVSISESRIPRFVSNGADVGALAVFWGKEIQPGDYLEVFVTNETDNTNVSVEAFYFSVAGTLT